MLTDYNVCLCVYFMQASCLLFINFKYYYKMENTKYNGWTNRNTWLINLWYEPHTTSDLDWIKDELEERASTLANSENVCDKILSDMLDLQAIDWDELKEHVETEETCEV